MMEEEPQSSSLSQLIVSLEQATFMAKQLSSSSSNSTNPNHLNQIHTSLHQAHHQLTAFLSTLQPPPAAESSVSSANGAARMQLGDDGDDDNDDDEETSKCTIDRVEEKLRECFIKNKRPKRPLSPPVVAQGDNRRLSDDGFVKDYDPHSSKMKKALDLVYQFHG